MTIKADNYLIRLIKRGKSPCNDTHQGDHFFYVVPKNIEEKYDSEYDQISEDLAVPWSRIGEVDK
jgi:hypothetical protein